MDATQGRRMHRTSQYCHTKSAAQGESCAGKGHAGSVAPSRDAGKYIVRGVTVGLIGRGYILSNNTNPMGVLVQAAHLQATGLN